MKRAIVLAVLGISALPAPAAADPYVGFANDMRNLQGRPFTTDERAIRIHDLRIRYLRVNVDWELIQRSGSSSFNWSYFDALRDSMAARGIRPLFQVLFTPEWAADPLEKLQQCPLARNDFVYWRNCGGYRLPPAVSQLGAWATFIDRLVRRYATPADTAHYWPPVGIEVWNEPNSERYWKPAIDPARYVQLLRRTNLAVKAVDPSIPVMVGGLASEPGQPTEPNDQVTTDADVFLDQVYAHGGADHFDAIATHNYASTNRAVDDPDNKFNVYLDGLREVRDDRGDSDTRFWITEFGYYTQHPGRTPPIPLLEEDCQANWVTESFQADQTVRAVRHVRDTTLNPDIEGFFIHTLIDYGDADSCNPEDHFGLLYENNTPKPSWTALKTELEANPLTR